MLFRVCGLFLDGVTGQIACLLLDGSYDFELGCRAKVDALLAKQQLQVASDVPT